MKNAVLNLAAFLLLASAFTACKKEKTFKDQLTGHWLSTHVMREDENVTDTYTYELHLDENQEFQMDVATVVPTVQDPVVINQTFRGDWDENEKKQDLTLIYNDGERKTWEILSISDTKMTAELIGADSKPYQVSFERQ